MKKALIFQGGWDGHEPALTAKRFARLLTGEGVECEIYDTLDCLRDAEKLMTYDLFVSCWTMGDIPRECSQNIARAVGAGAGLAGCHGGMCDSFRQDTEWQFMTGGQWVSHPGGDGVEYTVNVRRGNSPITEGIE
ncbi:MAG: ThuA domain-containing protein, partial [Eubacteriales bacterium]